LLGLEKGIEDIGTGRLGGQFSGQDGDGGAGLLHLAIEFGNAALEEIKQGTGIGAWLRVGRYGWRCDWRNGVGGIVGRTAARAVAPSL
jgi:hypothetical protein